jgi:hypothetical protein
MFYPKGKSLGKHTLDVAHPSGALAKFRENLSWKVNSVTFAMAHVVGSNDNRGRTPEMDAEADERMNANNAWLQ